MNTSELNRIDFIKLILKVKHESLSVFNFNICFMIVLLTLSCYNRISGKYFNIPSYICFIHPKESKNSFMCDMYHSPPDSFDKKI